MSTLQPYGTFPTPYGVSVPVYLPEAVNPANPEHVLFSMDGTAIFAGIHDKAERVRFAADAHRLGHMPAFEDYGGAPVPKVPLPKPREPAYPRVAGMEADIPIEAWTTGMLDHFRWCDRAEYLIGLIGENQEQATWSRDEIVEEIYPLGLSMMLTAALEHLCEMEIDCIEAAALYALTEHEEWREAGITWLRPFQNTWFRDWRDSRPRYSAFARRMVKVFALPNWLCGSGGGA
ncbi:hypothetical protein MKK75_10180 [Methylobacterium sp. J-030]|uniref:hypothetical protein n=1 Tax=Methylobacterium sp. J-030 TaxID=2836627 RepID=UPI001FBA971D|nr:hypothetical protein [Methylobacterium sp. J-030]MCJ2069166.1 hypothetical protein [Methylobacterium sp. J-030]